MSLTENQGESRRRARGGHSTCRAGRPERSSEQLPAFGQPLLQPRRQALVLGRALRRLQVEPAPLVHGQSVAERCGMRVGADRNQSRVAQIGIGADISWAFCRSMAATPAMGSC